MQLNGSITEIIIFLVFVVAFMIFSISPAIWISEKMTHTFQISTQYSHKIILFFTIFFASLASFFLYS